MSFFDQVEQAAGGMMGGNSNNSMQIPENANDNTRVAGSFIQTASEHPGGLGGIMDMIRGNGMGQHVDQWQNGQNQQATPEQVQNGLGGGMLDKIAQRAGVSPETAKVALAATLPFILAHMTNNGQQAPPQGGGLLGAAGSLLTRFL